MANEIQPGVYSVDYFSGAQVGIYIGDVLVDEVTSIQWFAQQRRRPLYGYSDQLYRAMSKGPVIIQGNFTINFKEAGYLWLILDRYQKLIRGKPGRLSTPFNNSQSAEQLNIESLLAGEPKTVERTKLLKGLAARVEVSKAEYEQQFDQQLQAERNDTAANLGGFASITRASGGMGKAENLFEAFEDMVWGKSKAQLDELDRRADDPDLNPFDIYISYGDFAGDNRVNHTIRRLSNVTIIGSGQQIEVNGLPVQEQYVFLARNIV